MMLLIRKFCHGCGIGQENSLLQPLFLLFATFAALMLIQTGAWATESLLKHEKPWTGDLDGMVERRKIRALVPYSKTFYFLDGATQRGVAYEGMQIFGKWLNKELGTGHLKVRVVRIFKMRFAPFPRVNILIFTNKRTVKLDNNI